MHTQIGLSSLAVFSRSTLFARMSSSFYVQHNYSFIRYNPGSQTSHLVLDSTRHLAEPCQPEKGPTDPCSSNTRTISHTGRGKSSSYELHPKEICLCDLQSGRLKPACSAIEASVWLEIIEPLGEKTGFLHMQNQRRRSASR